MRFINQVKKIFRKALNNEHIFVLAKNSSWIFISNFIKEFLNVIKAIIVARTLGAEFFGLYVIISTFVLTIQEILNANMGTTLIKFGAEYIVNKSKDKIAALFKVCFFISIIASILSIFLVGISASIFYKNILLKYNLFWIIIFLTFSFCTYYFDFLSLSLLRLYSRFKLYSIVSIIMSIVEFSIVVFSLIYFKRNLHFFFFAIIASRLLNSILSNLTVYIELKLEIGHFFKVKMNLVSADWQEIKKFSFGNSISRTLKTFLDKLDILFIGFYSGPFQSGLYAVAKRLAYSLLLFTDPLTNVIFPQLSFLIAEKKIADLKKMIFKLSKLAISVLVPVAMLSSFYGKKIIILFFGNEFASASSTFIILLINAILGVVLFWMLSLIQSLGMMKIRFFTYLLALIVSLSIFYLLIPRYGALGAAIGVLIGNILIQLSFVYFSLKKMNLITNE